MQVFVVQADWAIDGNSNSELKVFSSEYEARRFFEQKKEDLKQVFNVFDIHDNLDNDLWELTQEENYFELYEEGYYNENHCVLTLTKTKVL